MHFPICTVNITDPYVGRIELAEGNDTAAIKSATEALMSAS